MGLWGIKALGMEGGFSSRWPPKPRVVNSPHAKKWHVDFILVRDFAKLNVTDSIYGTPLDAGIRQGPYTPSYTDEKTLITIKKRGPQLTVVRVAFCSAQLVIRPDAWYESSLFVAAC